MRIHVNADLNQDQLIYKSISFYDLVELMTFGRLSFQPSPDPLRSSPSRPGANQRVAFDTTAVETSKYRKEIGSGPDAASTGVAHQSWTLFEHERAIDWTHDDTSEPAIHIISSVHALADSLLVGDDVEVFIDPTSHVACAPTRRPSARANAVPIPDHGTLTVTLCSRSRAMETDRYLVPRLPLDLKTMLTRVIVSPKAPARFVELVSDLVQRISHATVSRASGSI